MFTVVSKLKINGTAKTAVVEDTTAYTPTLSFSDVDVQGTFTVVGPDGAAIIVGGNIDLSGGDTESAAFNLPLDSNGDILNGTYTLTYFPTFTVTNFAVASFDAGADTITISNVDWIDIFDEVGASNEVTTSGATAPADNGTFDVLSASFFVTDTIIAVDTALTSEDPTAATISFDVSYVAVTDIYTFNGCDEVTPTATVTTYCNTTQFGQIIFEDTTSLPSGQSLDTRLWNISYPGNLVDPVTPADVTSALPSITINTLATGTWTWRLTYDVTVTQTDGLVYTYTASSIATEVQVECLTTLCELRCGINKLHEQWAQAVNGGAITNEFSNAVNLVNAYWIDATNAINCGDQSDFDFYAGLILDQLTLKNVNCDCGCAGESTATGNHWINNAGFESQTEIANLIADVTTLQTDLGTAQSDIVTLQSETATNTLDIQTVTGFAQVLAGNVNATNDYNAIVANITIAFSDAANYNAQIGAVVASLAGLNPNDEAFDDAVDNLESIVSGIISDLSGLDVLVNTILGDITTFNTTYPEFNTLFDQAIALLASVSGALVSSQSYAATLLTSLQGLTSVNYNAEIAGINATLAQLQADVNVLTTYQNLTNSSINGIYFALGQLIPIVLQNQSDIAALQATSSIDEIYAVGNVNVPLVGFAAYLPGMFFQLDVINGVLVSGYVKIRVSGQDLSGAPFTIVLQNTTLNQTVWSQAFLANTKFSIDLILAFDWVTNNTFTIAGDLTTTTAGVSLMETIMQDMIPLTKVAPNVVNALKIGSNSIGTDLYRVEIIGVKLF